MSVPFPEPTTPVPARAEVFLGYLDYFRSRLVSKLEALPTGELRRSRLPSGWTPIELLNHLTWVERRWLEWGFEGHDVADPWADSRDGRWYVAAGETREELVGRCASRPRVPGPSSSLMILPTSASRAIGGMEPIRPRSSASCSICSRSTPATSVTSTSSANSPAARPESDQRPGQRPVPWNMTHEMPGIAE